MGFRMLLFAVLSSASGPFKSTDVTFSRPQRGSVDIFSRQIFVVVSPLDAQVFGLHRARGQWPTDSLLCRLKLRSVREYGITLTIRVAETE
jgi:hypothetical protein